MILRDFYCPDCGTERRDIVVDSISAVTREMYCGKCHANTLHLTLCNGGMKKRFRQQDWPDARQNPDFYAGQMDSSASLYTVDKDGNERPVEFCENSSGKGAVDAAPKFTGDARLERRDRISHDFRKRAGKTPLYVDQKGGA